MSTPQNEEDTRKRTYLQAGFDNENAQPILFTTICSYKQGSTVHQVAQVTHCMSRKTTKCEKGCVFHAAFNDMISQVRELEQQTEPSTIAKSQQ